MGGKETRKDSAKEFETAESQEVDRLLTEIASSGMRRFQQERRILSFPQFIELFRTAPVRHSRNAAQYVCDAYEYFGTRQVPGLSGRTETRFCLFDAPFDSGSRPLFGHEPLQREIHRRLKRFAASGRADRLLLLHGPNGSAKSTAVDLIIRALEYYSTLDEGAIFRFNWIFPNRPEGRERLGFGGERVADPGRNGYAFLDEREIACKLPCELREHPLFLLPPEERRKLFEELIAAKPDDELLTRRLRGPWLRTEGLSAKSRAIYEALMNVHQGDWRAVMRHVQVERWFVSRRYRQGAASVEPQQAVDAGARPLTFEQGPALPAALHGLQLFTLFGELADASGGVIDYADFLKRPLELNKYLLSACELGAVPVSGINADLNVVFFGTCNEKQLSAFKALPDFPSYMGRIELLRVPYLLEWSKEEELYRRWLTEIAETRHIAPHTAALTAIWAVLTRVRRPDPGKYPEQAVEVVKNLTPLEKANFYNDGSLPDRLNSEERRELAAVRELMTKEFDDAMAIFEDFPDSAYEGRRGASAREVKALLADAAADAKHPCLSPTGVFAAMELLSHHKTVYEFLRLEVEGAYHDAPVLLDAVREEYLRRITVEVYDSLGLIAAEEYERRIREYFHHVRAFVSGEKVRREADGAPIPPSEEVMTGIEKHLSLKEPAEQFRRNLVARIAAYALDNPEEKIDYLSVCSNFFGNLKRNYYEEKRRQLERLAKPIPLLGTEEEKTLPPAEKKQAEAALKTLREKYGYCSHCAREAVTAVLRAIASA